MQERKSIIEDENSFIIENVLPEDEDLFTDLKNEISWQTMFSRNKPVPRLITLQAETTTEFGTPIYRHPIDFQPKTTDFTPTVLKIKNIIESELGGEEFNHCVIQYYRSGYDHISEHTDKTLDIDPSSKIANVSLGALRQMILKNKATKQKIKFGLPDKSVFIMSMETNRKWLHSIKQDKRIAKIKSDDENAYEGERISLTFRKISTYIKDGVIIGQSAKKSSIMHAHWYEYNNLLRAYSRENNDPNFNWNKYYGSGFHIIDFHPNEYYGYIMTRGSVCFVQLGNTNYDEITELNNFINKNKIDFLQLKLDKTINIDLLYPFIRHKVVILFGDFSQNIFQLITYRCPKFFVLTKFSENYEKYNPDCLINDWTSLFKYKRPLKTTDNTLLGSSLVSINTEPKTVIVRKLFINIDSRQSKQVIILLYYLGLEFECHYLKNDEIQEFKKINPRCNIPTLIEPDGQVITESIAIMQYLDNTYNDSQLSKNHNPLVLSRIQEVERLYHICVYWLNNDISISEIHNELNFWETYLTKTKYLVYNTKSLVDFIFYPIIAEIIKQQDIHSYPNILTYFNMISNKYYAKLTTE